MSVEQIIILLSGIFTVIAGLITDVDKTRRGQRWAKLIGKTGVKLLTIVVGIALVVASFFI